MTKRKTRVPLSVIDAMLAEIADQRANQKKYQRSLRAWEVRLYRLSGWRRHHQAEARAS